MKDSASNPGLPSGQPVVPNSRRPDVTTRSGGLTTQIVEMKFGGDEPSRGQIKDYPKIAESLGKQQGNQVDYKLIKVDRDCDCENWKKDQQEQEQAATKESAERAMAGAAMRLAARRLVGGPVTAFFGTLLESAPAY